MESRAAAGNTGRKCSCRLVGISASARFAAFREIADSIDAKLMWTWRTFAGLVAAGEASEPVPHADVVTTTIHKTLADRAAG